jgi:hypothetical protein
MVVRSDPRRCSDDGGAILVEAAFVLPILFYFLFGIIEYGLVFKSYSTLGNNLRVAARMAAVKGNEVDTDYAILQAIKRETNAVDPRSIQRIVIYKANPSTPGNPPKQVPAACVAGSPDSPFTVGAPDFCNVYGPTRDFNGARVAADYNCVTTNWAGSTTAPLTGWCPSTRFAAANASTDSAIPVSGPPDTVGVFMEIKHKYMTGLFGTTKTLSTSYFATIEPKSSI